MVDRHDYVALEWVKDEIADTLKQARVALDSDGQQATPEALAQCLACVHQVHGSLLMVEFYGAALLAEEMEQLVIALQQRRVSQLDEAVRAATGLQPIAVVPGARPQRPARLAVGGVAVDQRLAHCQGRVAVVRNQFVQPAVAGAGAA